MDFKLALIFYIFIFLHINFAFDLTREGCNFDLSINNEYYNVSAKYLVGEADPTDAHYDVFGNLFFVETVRDKNGHQFNIKVIKFQTVDPDVIPDLPEGISYSVAVDRKDTKVFFGTGRGLYTYNYETHKATLMSESTLNVNMIFIDKHGKKFISQTKDGIEELYLYENKKTYIVRTLEALNEMAIDDKNNFYYIKNDKLCVLKWSDPSPVCIGNVSYDGMAQISFQNDTVFVASDNLWYFHENETGNLK